MLKLDNVYVTLGDVDVLRGISLEVSRGEIVMLAGRNGAGKTTTLKSVMSLVPIKRGRVLFDCEDVTGRGPEYVARRGVGYAPEDRRIFPDLTVLENIEVAIRDIRERYEILRTIFEVFPELKGLLNRKGGNLSGGQQKMLAIARALAIKPKLLLLDEPFEGLAPIVVKRLYEGIRAIKGLGISVLLAESSIVHATHIADKVYVIERGEIIFEGSSAEAVESVISTWQAL